MKKDLCVDLFASMGVLTAALAPIHILAAPGDLFDAFVSDAESTT